MNTSAVLSTALLFVALVLAACGGGNNGGSNGGTAPSPTPRPKPTSCKSDRTCVDSIKNLSAEELKEIFESATQSIHELRASSTLKSRDNNLEGQAIASLTLGFSLRQRLGSGAEIAPGTYLKLFEAFFDKQGNPKSVDLTQLAAEL